MRLLTEALKATVGDRAAQIKAHREFASRPGDSFDAHQAPCPFCPERLRDPSAVWGHIQRKHELTLTPEQKDQVWGDTCIYGCGFPIVSSRSLAQHIGRAHPTQKGGQLFTALAEVLANDKGDLGKAVLDRIVVYGTPKATTGWRARGEVIPTASLGKG